MDSVQTACLPPVQIQYRAAELPLCCRLHVNFELMVHQMERNSVYTSFCSLHPLRNTATINIHKRRYSSAKKVCTDIIARWYRCVVIVCIKVYGYILQRRWRTWCERLGVLSLTSWVCRAGQASSCQGEFGWIVNELCVCTLFQMWWSW